MHSLKHQKMELIEQKQRQNEKLSRFHYQLVRVQPSHLLQ
jgi:hypothetical protein